MDTGAVAMSSRHGKPTGVEIRRLRPKRGMWTMRSTTSTGRGSGRYSDLFVDERDDPEYVGVEPGSITDRSVLVPAEVITIDDGLRRMVVSRP